MTTVASLHREINSRIGPAVYADIFQFVKRQCPRLWGEVQPRSYLEVNLLLTLWKDCFGDGYDKIEGSLSLPFSISKRALMHNVKAIRRLLADWGETHVKLGTAANWNSAARHVTRTYGLQV